MIKDKFFVSFWKISNLKTQILRYEFIFANISINKYFSGDVNKKHLILKI